MKKINLILILPLLCSFCRSTQSTVALTLPIPQPISVVAQDSLFMVVEALNMSEDMSVLSTNNDEILLLLYVEPDSLTELSKPLLIKQLLFDENNLKKRFVFACERALSNRKFLLFLIELDYETPAEQIDPVIRIHYQSIIDAHSNMYYTELEKYLGNEDFLGTKTIYELPTDFRIKGVYKLDRYDYRIKMGLSKF